VARTPFDIDGSAHVLLAGDSRDIPAMRRLVASLPMTAYGQVFIEIVTDVQRELLLAPPGVQVSWLLRDRNRSDSDPRHMALSGELVARAVRAWANEWMPEADLDETHHYVLWIGCTANARVHGLFHELSEILEARSLDTP